MNRVVDLSDNVVEQDAVPKRLKTAELIAFLFTDKIDELYNLPKSDDLWVIHKKSYINFKKRDSSQFNTKIYGVYALKSHSRHVLKVTDILNINRGIIAQK